MLAAIDIALLASEWAHGSRWPACPVCEGPQPGGGHEKYLAKGHEDYKGGHQVGCAMDQALSERGWSTAQERDAARKRLHEATSATEPPPVGAT